MNTEAIAAMGLLGFIMSFMMFLVAWYVLSLVARWKVFDKAGIAGWKSLIPIYSDYCTYKIAWETKFFWIFLILGAVSGFISNRMSAYTESGNTVPFLLSVLSYLIGLAIFVINLAMNINLAKRFGNSTAFGVGLAFLTPIFTMILGLGASEYRGNPIEGLPPQRGYRY